MTKLELAKVFATNAHEGQKYAGGPYTAHLEAVISVLQSYGVTDEDLLCAAWLHDVVEDTKVELWQIKRVFGSNVAAFVHAVTNEPGKNRAERHLKTYPKILACPDALTLKLADRLANVQQCLKELKQTGISKLLGMYHKEHDGFKKALWLPTVTPLEETMFTELDRMLMDSV